jgi:ABC-type dipeptide/oligopeptide/nickel transport system ATPase subunit
MANLTKGTYNCVYVGKDCDDENPSPDETHYLAVLWNNEFNSEVILPDDRGNVEKLVNISYMRKFFAQYHGEEYYWVRYRKLVEGEYRPYRLEAFPAEDYSDDNQSIYLYFMDLSGRLYQESNYVGELLQSLSENYEGIYYVDFDKDITIPYRMSKVINENFGTFFRTNPSYETAMSAYVKATVAKKDLQEMMDLLHFSFDWDDQINSLPFGQRKLLEIVRSLLSNPRVMLVDEPAAGLNNKEIEYLMDILRMAAKKRNVGILLIEHSMDMIMDICESIVVLSFGVVIAEGTPEQIANDPAVIEAYLGREEE